MATLDSGLAVDAFAFEILNATQEGLYRLNKNEKAEPAMALEDPKVSKDGKVYTIKLRKNNRGTARLTNPQLKNRIIHFVGTTEYKEAYIKK
ncbi:hypothetical protein [Macrococcus armenti]|uniref:Uncharacterized protein n=1 Tax=Macrococcus armenti TaxID=2875764 RepID=A0ABY3ZXI2_9STAP|nr:hypothetical protein [Macrococcus armenti]UOB20561.1 hypothetical protein MRZ06_00285 [Macrococcus armenti]